MSSFSIHHIYIYGINHRRRTDRGSLSTVHKQSRWRIFPRSNGCRGCWRLADWILALDAQQAAESSQLVIRPRPLVHSSRPQERSSNFHIRRGPRIQLRFSTIHLNDMNQLVSNGLNYFCSSQLPSFIYKLIGLLYYSFQQYFLLVFKIVNGWIWAPKCRKLQSDCMLAPVHYCAEGR